MAGTQIWTVSRMRPARGRASAASGKGSRSHRMGFRLWTLLNAQALLNGRARTPDSAAFVEDNRQRMAARRAN